MKFSIIIPSYNQDKFIRASLINVIDLKKAAAEKNIIVEILLFDNNSNEEVQKIINEFRSSIDNINIGNDNGQYDAINKGISICKGDYWTWLNTDDTIVIPGFLTLTTILKSNSAIDYVYGDINYIDENGNYLRTIKSKLIDKGSLVNFNPGIYQPGSFFKTSFTKSIGILANYECCFDYEYVLRCLSNNANIYRCDFAVANFRLHGDSKSRAIIPVFIKEQLQISGSYGRKFFSFLTWILYLRLLKHKLFPGK